MSYPTVALIGHPFAPIGMGEHVRCSFRSLARAAVRADIVDIYSLCTPEDAQLREFSPYLGTEFADINIFHMNGDEVEQALGHLTYHKPLTGYNIVYPAWELSRYPKEWATQLDRFDEIWAPSQFIADSLRAACLKPVVHMPLGTEIVFDSFLPRRFFGIKDDHYCFLFFFDLKSYVNRKNPGAVLEAFRSALRRMPNARTTLVIKVNGYDSASPALDPFREVIDALGDRVRLITETLSDNQIKNLIRCCDCFVSLHRSEGFGRGISEAMYLGKPVVATAYSGNLDFMAPDVSFPVSYELRPLREGDYPHFADQVWAEPDVGEAARHMARLLEQPRQGRDVGARAELHMRRNFSFRPTGVRYRRHIEDLWATRK